MALSGVLLLAAAAVGLPMCADDKSDDPVGRSGERAEVTARTETDTIALQLVRMNRETGPALVSSGVPLPAGWLLPENAAHVAVVVGGEQVALYVEPLAATYPDGTARAVLLQFSASVATGSPVPALLILGPTVTRTLPDREKTPITWTLPAAAALPTSPAYLVRTEFAGQTIPVSASPAAPAVFPAYEADFVQYGNSHWALESGNWIYNYYDRALIWYAWWARTGNPEYWRRGTIDAVAYRDQYVVPASYQMQPHNALLEGLAAHYLLTGDERSRYTIARVGIFFAQIWTPQLDCMTCNYLEGRIQARTLLSHYLGWMLDAVGDGPPPQSWSALMASDVTKILNTQGADGSYRFQASWEGAHSNYMTGLVHDALIKYYTYVTPDPRIPPAIKKTLDWMWATQWVASPEGGAFKYLSDSTSSGGTDPAPDLNMLIVTGYGWYYALTGDGTYKARGEEIFTGGVRRAYLDGYKQFNQNYTSSFHYLAYRSQPNTAGKLP